MNYIEKVKKFHKLNDQIRKIKNNIPQEFVSYCWEKYPDKISKLEEKIKKKIIEIDCIRYIYKYKWCEVLLINTNDGYISLVITYDFGWDKSRTITPTIYDLDNDIIIILKELYNEFPYIKEVYL